MRAAVASPLFVHPRVASTGGAANYAMVLGYLASHQAWDHFQTVLTRGVVVSESEEPEGPDPEREGEE